MRQLNNIYVYMIYDSHGLDSGWVGPWDRSALRSGQVQLEPSNMCAETNAAERSISGAHALKRICLMPREADPPKNYYC